ncbi:DUF4307 domain-containing protein [Mycolicibacterium thermoresistibile]
MIERPTARYGRQPVSAANRRWLVIGVTVLAVIVSAIVAVIAYQRLGSPEVEGEMGAYRVLDDQTVEVTISVTREDPTQPVVCIVRARSRDGTETGRREILVPPSTDTVVQVTTVVKTSQPPFVGGIYGCGAEVPDYLIAP